MGRDLVFMIGLMKDVCGRPLGKVVGFAFRSNVQSQGRGRVCELSSSPQSKTVFRRVWELIGFRNQCFISDS